MTERASESNVSLVIYPHPWSRTTKLMFLKKAHHVLLEIEVINGDLVCPETGRKFPVSDGIPNMLLNEDEV